MATIEVFMVNNRQCTDELRAEAVKQVIPRGGFVSGVRAWAARAGLIQIKAGPQRRP